MACIRQAGITPTELDALIDVDRWRQWCCAEPDLAQLDSLAVVRKLRGKEEDRALGALLRLAAADAGDDQLAAVAVLHQLGGSVRVIARHFWHLSQHDVEGIVVGAMWDQIRSYDWRNRSRHHAGAIHHGTRKTVRATLMPDTSKASGDRLVLVDPQSWVFGSVEEHPDRSTTRLDDFDSHDQLDILLNWASSRGVVNDDDIGLLNTLIDLDRSNPQIPLWRRGACSMAAVEQMATDLGVCAKSVHRARDKVLAKLRNVAPLFLEDVA